MSELIDTLVRRQLETIPSDKRLKFRDFQRLVKYLPYSIFDTDECCIWKENKLEQTRYINFYFNKKKVSIQRLLYENYIGELSKGEYLKFTCKNKGMCCNINHFEKIVSKDENNNEIKKSKVDRYKIPDDQDFSIEFD